MTFKGTPLKKRGKSWHTKHMARLKKRKAHRHLMLTKSRASRKHSRALSKKYNTKELEERKLLEKELERGKIYWFFVRWLGRIRAFFPTIISIIKRRFNKGGELSKS